MTSIYRTRISLLTVLGAAVGLVGGIVCFPVRVLAVLTALAGGWLGWRIGAGQANRELKRLTAILFEEVRPEAFLAEFTPLVAQMPAHSLDYVEGSNKLAYAMEALGRFDDALACLDALEPEKVKKNSLGAMATTCSNRVRLQLLRQDLPGVQKALAQLEEVTARAEEKIPALGKSLRTYRELYKNWLLVLRREDADTQCLQLEVERSMNRIRRSEIQLLLAKHYETQGEQALADDLYIEVLGTGAGLWAETVAREKLGAAG